MDRYRWSPENAQAALLVGSLIGYAWSNANTVISYFFGSSKSSASKDAAIHSALDQNKNGNMQS